MKSTFIALATLSLASLSLAAPTADPDYRNSDWAPEEKREAAPFTADWDAKEREVERRDIPHINWYSDTNCATWIGQTNLAPNSSLIQALNGAKGGLPVDTAPMYLVKFRFGLSGSDSPVWPDGLCFGGDDILAHVAPW